MKLSLVLVFVALHAVFQTSCGLPPACGDDALLYAVEFTLPDSLRTQSYQYVGIGEDDRFYIAGCGEAGPWTTDGVDVACTPTHITARLPRDSSELFEASELVVGAGGPDAFYRGVIEIDLSTRPALSCGTEFVQVVDATELEPAGAP